MRTVLAPGEKPLHWVGPAKRDFLGFPDGVRDDIGNALGLAQFGGKAPTAKPWNMRMAAKDYEEQYGRSKQPPK